MATKKNVKTEKVEREYTIPLREKCRSVAIYKKTPKAIKTVKEFLARHMKVENRDLKKVKLDKFVNEAIWARGIKKPLHKIKVKAVKENGIVTVELFELSKKFKDKKIREEKMSALGDSNIKKKADKASSASTPTNADAPSENLKSGSKKKAEDKDKDGVEDSVEEKEKEKAVEEVNQEKVKKESKEIKSIKSSENKIAAQKSDKVARLGKKA